MTESSLTTAKTLSLDEACALRDDVSRFLRDSDLLAGFRITNQQDNYWRDTREAETRTRPNDLRPTVTSICLEAEYSTLHADGTDLENRRRVWVWKALSALRRLNQLPGNGLNRLQSTMSNRGPNV